MSYTDPTGNFSLGSLSTGMNIQGILTTVNTASSAYDVFSFAISDEQLTAKQAGLLALSMMSPKILGKVFKSFRPCNSLDGDALVATKQGLVAIKDIQIGRRKYGLTTKILVRSHYRMLFI